MRAIDLLEAVERKLGTNSQTELATAIGVTLQTLTNWRNRDENLSATQIASAPTRARASTCLA